MKNYYEILGIDKDADAQCIKRAYFKQVREYPPERFPEEFKQIREAYDTLSDGDKRETYDRRGNIPEHAVPLFNHALELLKRGNLKESAETLEFLAKTYPECDEFKVELAFVYERTEKNGKAAKIWEELYKKEPDNLEHVLHLARSYMWRGWHKKAIPFFKRATTLDPGERRAWDGLVSCYGEAQDVVNLEKACTEGIASLGERNITSAYIHVYAFSFDISKADNEAAKGRLKDLLEMARTGNADEVAHALKQLLSIVMDTNSYDMLPYIREIADALPNIENELTEHLYDAETYVVIEGLKSQGYPALFRDLFNVLSGGYISNENADDLTAMECSILRDLEGYRPHLLRLKKERPELYNLHAEFFNEVLLTHNQEKLLYSRLKRLSKKGTQPMFMPASADEPIDEDTPVVETVRRDGPKVGRNDPCPCGSGKKFKKCCGR